MGYETSYGFTRLRGADKDYRRFLTAVGKENEMTDRECKALAEEESYFGRWYWPDMKEALIKTSREFPDLLVEVTGEIHDDCDVAWKARFRNGESEEANAETFYRPFTNGNLIPAGDDSDPEKATRDFVENSVAAAAFELKEKAEELLSARKWNTTVFRGKKIFGMFLIHTVLEQLAEQYGPSDEDLRSKEGKRVKGLLQAEYLGLK